MSDSGKIELTRRKILASMGAVGAAGAGAGLGTSALFSDTEGFENNTLTAGKLDLKMDWEEHYSYPPVVDDDFGDPTVEGGTDLDVVREDPDDPDYVALPDPNPSLGLERERDPVVWANDNDDPTGSGSSSLELYFQNTIIEAFPDESATDPQGTFTAINSGGDPVVQSPCNMLADVSSPGLSTYNGPDQDGPDGGSFQDPGRTFNSDTYDEENDEREPLLNLTDVKPGDFGEFTFSTHICDNPGYLWLQMPGGLTEFENGRTEPEAEVDDTGGNPGEGQGELAENVETTLWYDDNCNNRIDGEAEPLVALAVLDTSQSQEPVLSAIAEAANRFVERLAADANTDVYAGVITLEDTGDDRDAVLQSLPNEPPITEVENYIDSNGDGKFVPGGDILPGPNEVGGNSPLPHALDVAREYLNDQVANDPNNVGLPNNPNKEILLLSDGAPGYGTGGGTSQAGEGRGALVDANTPGAIIQDSSGSGIVSDYFDSSANNSTIRYPNPSTTDGGFQRAETVLVARDIDGGVFAPGTSEEQSQAAKFDNPDQDGDPADISGENDITVKTVVSYDTTSSVNQSLADDTMQAISTGQGSGNFYNLAQQPAEDIADAIFADLNVVTGEEVIFRGTLKELANELDPQQNGPVALDHDRTTSGQDCFPASVTHCFGLAWWVPEDIGNEIQSDSVSFDLGFYTEQCRNNEDPTGPNTPTPS